ncbi:hypothetical protein LZ32DRAFT_608098 [Colletotrichum eremochloae]|nr:hypothetical protein LZ32DRAFT_608098 [Colletotrichum eremochloae]
MAVILSQGGSALSARILMPLLGALPWHPGVAAALLALKAAQDRNGREPLSSHSRVVNERGRLRDSPTRQDSPKIESLDLSDCDDGSDRLAAAGVLKPDPE